MLSPVGPSSTLTDFHEKTFGSIFSLPALNHIAFETVEHHKTISGASCTAHASLLLLDSLKKKPADQDPKQSVTQLLSLTADLSFFLDFPDRSGTGTQRVRSLMFCTTDAHHEGGRMKSKNMTANH